MGAFWNVVQAELDRTQDPRFKPPSNRELATRLGVSPQTVTNWRNGLTRLPSEKNIRAVADFAGRPYVDVLVIALSETGHARGTNIAARLGMKDVGDDQ